VTFPVHAGERELNKVHWIRDYNANCFPHKIVTHCGREGWKERHVKTEFTDGLNIFEAVQETKQVTCKVCARHLRRADGETAT